LLASVLVLVLLVLVEVLVLLVLVEVLVPAEASLPWH
jgi:hypothetical protein